MSRRARSEPYAEGQGLPVRPGEVVVVRDEGMPIYDSARIKRRNAKGKDGNDDDIEKGDLYISFEIEMPSQEWLFNINSKVRFWSKLYSRDLLRALLHFRPILSCFLWFFPDTCVWSGVSCAFVRLPVLPSLRLGAGFFSLETLGGTKQAGKSQVSVYSAVSAHVGGHGTRLPATSTCSFWSPVELSPFGPPPEVPPWLRSHHMGTNSARSAAGV